MVGWWRSVVVAVIAVSAAAACSRAEDVQPGEDPAGVDTIRATGRSLLEPDTLPTGVTPEMVARGEQQFKAGVCIACHGRDAGGTSIAPNLKDFEWLNTDGSYQGIQDVIRAGVPEPKQHPGAMQPMGGTKLTEQQISEIAAYIVSIRGRS